MALTLVESVETLQISKKRLVAMSNFIFQLSWVGTWIVCHLIGIILINTLHGFSPWLYFLVILWGLWIDEIILLTVTITCFGNSNLKNFKRIFPSSVSSKASTSTDGIQQGIPRLAKEIQPATHATQASEFDSDEEF